VHGFCQLRIRVRRINVHMCASLLWSITAVCVRSGYSWTPMVTRVILVSPMFYYMLQLAFEQDIC